MKRIFILLLLVTTMCFSASEKECDSALTSRGYSIESSFKASPELGVIAKMYTASKNSHLYSIYVEIDSDGKVVIFDAIII